MPSNFTTNFRSFRLKLAEYEEDDLLIEEMAGDEGMSQLFEFQLRLRSHSDAIDPRKIIGKPADLQIETSSTDHNGGVRHSLPFALKSGRLSARPSPISCNNKSV